MTAVPIGPIRLLRMVLASLALTLALPGLGPLNAQLTESGEGLLDDEILQKLDAEDLLGYIDRAKVAIQSLADGNKDLEKRIAEMEKELAEAPAEIKGLTEEQAKDRIGELSVERANLRRELAVRLQDFRPLTERLDHAVKTELSRLADVPPPPDMIETAYGSLSEVPPSHYRCGEDSTSIAQVICRSNELAALDRRLSDVTRAALQKSNIIDRAFLDRAHKDFIASLSNCAGSVSAVLREPKRIETARGCAAQRYRTRIEALGAPPQVADDEPENPKHTPIGEIWFSDAAVNVRAGPSIETRILDKIPPCTPVQVVARLDGTPWYVVKVKGKDGYMHNVTLAKSKPSKCQEQSTPSSGPNSGAKDNSIQGRVTRVLTVSRIHIDGKLVTFAHVIDRGNSEQIADMRRFLDLFGQKLRCRSVPSTDGWICAGQMENGQIVDIGKAAIFNGAACPDQNAPSDYREAYRRSRARGNSLVCN